MSMFDGTSPLKLAAAHAAPRLSPIHAYRRWVDGDGAQPALRRAALFLLDQRLQVRLNAGEQWPDYFRWFAAAQSGDLSYHDINAATGWLGWSYDRMLLSKLAGNDNGLRQMFGLPVVVSVAPSTNYDGTAGSGYQDVSADAGDEFEPTDPTRTAGKYKPNLHVDRVDWQYSDDDGTLSVTVLAWDQDGACATELFVEGNSGTVAAGLANHSENADTSVYGAVYDIDLSGITAGDPVKCFARATPNDGTDGLARVIEFYVRKVPGGVTAYIDPTATLNVSSAMTVTAGNRVEGGTSGAMAVVTASSSGTTLTLSPISTDGGTTQPAFADTETLTEVEPDGTATGNTGTVSGTLAYAGSSGTWDGTTIGDSANPYWHMRAATAGVAASANDWQDAKYLCKTGTIGVKTHADGGIADYRYVRLWADTGESPTFDFGLASDRSSSRVDFHIRGFAFRQLHEFTGNGTTIGIGSGAEGEHYWYDTCTMLASAPGEDSMTGMGNGGEIFATDCDASDQSSFRFESYRMTRGCSRTNISGDGYSGTSCVINCSHIQGTQIGAEHSDVFQHQLGQGENILIQSFANTETDVLNACMFFTGVGGAGSGTFEDLAILGLLTDEGRNEINLSKSHVLIWHCTFAAGSLDLTGSNATAAEFVSVRNNLINELGSGSNNSVLSAAITAGDSILDANNFASTTWTTGTNGTTTPWASRVVDYNNGDYRPITSAPTATRLILRDAENDASYASPAAIGASATTAADETAPTVNSATVAADGESITFAMSEIVEVGSGGSGGFAVTMSGGGCTLTYSSGSGTSSLVYTTSRAIEESETGTHAYTQPGDGIQDPSGNDLATYSGASVTNDSEYASSSMADFQQDSASPHILCIDATSGTRAAGSGGQTWADFADANAINGLAVRHEPLSGASESAGAATAPTISFECNFTQSSSHYFWLRRRLNLANTDDSIYLKVGAGSWITLNSYGAAGPNNFNWVLVSGSNPMSVPATGDQTVIVQGREDGMIWDRLLFTTSAAYNPNSVNSGLGPDESPSPTSPASTTTIAAFSDAFGFATGF